MTRRWPSSAPRRATTPASRSTPSGSAWLARPSVAIRWHLASETHRFKTGTDDLDEQFRLLDGLFAREGPCWADTIRLRRAADRRLSRAFLNRAYEALRGGESRLARRC